MSLQTFITGRDNVEYTRGLELKIKDLENTIKQLKNTHAIKIPDPPKFYPPLEFVEFLNAYGKLHPNCQEKDRPTYDSYLDNHTKAMDTWHKASQQIAEINKLNMT